MKKLSNFKENKVELNNVNGGSMYSYSFTKWNPGPLSDAGNYIASMGFDVSGHWVYSDMPH